jgi:type II secretory pathway component PulF
VTFFLPKIADLFRTFSSLPLPTRILIRVSELCSRYWVWVLVPLGLALAVLKRMMSGKRGRHFTDSVKLRLPLIGGFLKEADVARFARTMALLVRAGVPVEKALALSGRTLNNTVLRDEIEAVRRNTVEHGQSVADGLARNGAFPVFARNMIAVGEESGRIDESLVDTAVFYEKEVDRRIALGTSLIEPAMILVVGGVVGFIVFAMLLPILTVSSSIQ